jgi:hypothetical protein
MWWIWKVWCRSAGIGPIAPDLMVRGRDSSVVKRLVYRVILSCFLEK